MKQRVCLLGLIVAALIWHPSSQAAPIDPLRYLPVQDAGRLKPYDTFAREALELIYGKTKFRGKDAVEVVTTWLVAPDTWDNMELFELRHAGVREALKLDSKRILYSAREIMSNERLPLVMQELRSVREQGDKLNPYFQAVQRMENQLTLYQSIKTGMAIRIVPKVDSDTWMAVNELPDELGARFREVVAKVVGVINPSGGESVASAAADLQVAVTNLISAARAVSPEKYPSETPMRIEVHYNQFHPFMWAWIAYLLSAFGWVAFQITRKVSWRRVGWLGLSVGMFLHAYGMGLRIYLAGRPPVSNMYETVVWVPWGALIFACILYKFQKQALPIIAATVISILCLILTDLAPTVLDESIHPLEPVLRSTFWLTTHVLIITISYAAFFLAFAMGDWVLFLFFRDEKKYAKEIAAGVLAIYRAIQIGVVLLAAGVILGGIWADYSWGRFWGWDPKETWALIALLGYVALLHGRLAGWARGFGTAAGAVVAFSLVIMAWYGVNFVLGAGLHSYGFGAGGVEWVSGFVAIHLIYVAFVATVRRSRLAAAKS